MSAARITAFIPGAALAIAIAGCGAPPPQKPADTAQGARAKPPAVEAKAADLTAGALGEYRSERFDLRLPLPDAKGWRVEDARSPWLEATHERAEAKLLVRAWREAGTVGRARCEAQARLWRDLPERERAEIVDERRIDVPPGFDTVVLVGVMSPARRDKAKLGDKGPVRGFAMAFGGWAHRCFAYVLTTSAQGKGAEELVAVRLATMVELSLQNITVERAIAPDVPREPVP